ncbi:MAG: kojibiose phosphorylase [Erysipelotrichaceae bacterium]|nr:MAG: kojibiose phosphorylase [Erysipelotrichaceae bacterium]
MTSALPKTLERNQRFSKAELAVDETIFSQSNGILGIRGSFAEGYGLDSDDPYALINGFYNTIPYHYEENSIHFPQFGQTIVKLMDTSSVWIETDCGQLQLSSAKLIDLKRWYVLSEGLTRRSAQYELSNGQRLIVHEERFVAQDVKHLIVSHIIIESIEYEGQLKITSVIQMPKVKVLNRNDPRIAQARKHLRFIGNDSTHTYATLSAVTENTDLSIEVAMTHDEVFDYALSDQGACAVTHQHLSPKQSFGFTKFQIFNTALTNPKGLSTLNLIEDLDTYKELKKKQQRLTQAFWDLNKVSLNDPESLLAFQYSIYQLNNSGGEHEQLQIAAKGISGEGYEGHYFWDTEIYMIPYFILTQPDKAKRLLMYRYHHLEDAIQEARKLGIDRGVKIPWRTINGTETSPYYPAGSAQIHINSDLAYSIMQYYYASEDEAFMIDYGFEMMLQTALFILDYGVFDRGVFHLNTVTGPDEYSTLVNDNYYTNVMAQRHFEALVAYAKEHKDQINPIFKKCDVDESILDEFSLAAQQMSFKIDEKHHVVAQDDNFLSKRNLDLATIPVDKHPMLLHYHPLFIYRHQLLKQSDTLLAMVLLNRKTDVLYKNSFDYYLSRTTHDSSLSKCMYGIAAYAIGLSNLGDEFFEDSLQIDLRDTKHHTQHGLHMANMGGTYLLVAYGLLGIRIEKHLRVAPVAHSRFTQVTLSFRYQGHHVTISTHKEHFTISTDGPLLIQLYDELKLVESSTQEIIKIS